MLKRGGTNLLGVRVDNRRFPTDFPPSGLSTTGVPTGGWWNYGGLLREVYLRKIDRADFNTVAVLPDLPCGSCDAHVTYKTTLRNYGDKAQRMRVTARLGARKIVLGTASVGAKKFATVHQAHRRQEPQDVVADAPVPLQHVADRQRRQEDAADATTCRRASARSRSSRAT